VWAETVPDVADSSAVIPAGQPEGPAMVPATVYPTVAPIGAAPAVSPTFEPTTFQGPGAYGEALDNDPFGDGSGYFTGTGFSALSTTNPDPIATFGTDLAPAGPTFGQVSMTITSTPSPMAQVFAQAAQQGDILTAFQAQRVMDSQTRMGSIWVDSLAGY
jgi:hypothetical protein